MATITRDNLFRAVEESSDEFVSRKAKRHLIRWAHDADHFNLGTWDKCPLDQAGLVREFEQRHNYSHEENTRFQNEASELDARILKLVTTDLVGELPPTGLAVYVN